MFLRTAGCANFQQQIACFDFGVRIEFVRNYLSGTERRFELLLRRADDSQLLKSKFGSQLAVIFFMEWDPFEGFRLAAFTAGFERETADEASSGPIGKFRAGSGVESV